MLKLTYMKIRKSLPTIISDDVVERIVLECINRTESLDLDHRTLLEDSVSITINNDTKEIDIRQHEQYGIYWSFDIHSGDLVST